MLRPRTYCGPVKVIDGFRLASGPYNSIVLATKRGAQMVRRPVVVVVVVVDVLDLYQEESVVVLSSVHTDTGDNACPSEDQDTGFLRQMERSLTQGASIVVGDSRRCGRCGLCGLCGLRST